MSVENIVDYVMKTPQNTNKMVLKGMLESEIEKHSGMTSVVYSKGTEYEIVEFEEMGTCALVSELTPTPAELEGALFGITAPNASFYWWEFLKLVYKYNTDTPIEGAVYLALVEVAEYPIAATIFNQNNGHYAVMIIFKEAAEYGLPYKPGIYMNTKYVDEDTWKMALCW